MGSSDWIGWYVLPGALISFLVMILVLESTHLSDRGEDPSAYHRRPWGNRSVFWIRIVVTLGLMVSYVSSILDARLRWLLVIFILVSMLVFPTSLYFGGKPLHFPKDSSKNG